MRGIGRATSNSWTLNSIFGLWRVATYWKQFPVASYQLSVLKKLFSPISIRPMLKFTRECLAAAFHIYTFSGFLRPGSGQALRFAQDDRLEYFFREKPSPPRHRGTEAQRHRDLEADNPRFFYLGFCLSRLLSHLRIRGVWFCLAAAVYIGIGWRLGFCCWWLWILCGRGWRSCGLRSRVLSTRSLGRG